MIGKITNCNYKVNIVKLSPFASHKGPQDSINLSFHNPQPSTSLHCETMDTGLVHCVVYLFIPTFHWYSFYISRKDGQAELTRAVD